MPKQPPISLLLPLSPESTLIWSATAGVGVSGKVARSGSGGDDATGEVGDAAVVVVAQETWDGDRRLAPARTVILKLYGRCRRLLYVFRCTAARYVWGVVRSSTGFKDMPENVDGFSSFIEKSLVKIGS